MKGALVLLAAAAAVFVGVLFYYGGFFKSEPTPENPTHKSLVTTTPSLEPEIFQERANTRSAESKGSGVQVANAPSSAEPSPPMQSEAFEKLLKGSSIAGMKTPVQTVHEKFEKESVDPSWSANVEPEVQSMMKQDDLLKVAHIASIECRKTICEVRAYARSAETNQISIRAFQDRLFRIVASDWAKGFGLQTPLAAMQIAPDGRALMLGYVSKDELK